MWPVKICAAVMTCTTIMSLPRVDEVKTQRQAFSADQELNISNDCFEINKNGKLLDLLKQVNADAQTLKSIFKNNQTLSRADDLQSLQDNINRATQKIINITQASYTEPRLATNFSWSVDLANFSNIQKEILDENFLLDDFELKSLQYAGQEREDLYNLVRVSQSGYNLVVQYQQQQSSLDICQLNATLIIRGDLVLAFQGKKYRQDIILTVRPGVDVKKTNNQNNNAHRDDNYNPFIPPRRENPGPISSEPKPTPFCRKPNDAPCGPLVNSPRNQF